MKQNSIPIAIWNKIKTKSVSFGGQDKIAKLNPDGKNQIKSDPLYTIHKHPDTGFVYLGFGYYELLTCLTWMAAAKTSLKFDD